MENSHWKTVTFSSTSDLRDGSGVGERPDSQGRGRESILQGGLGIGVKLILGLDYQWPFIHHYFIS